MGDFGQQESVVVAEVSTYSTGLCNCCDNTQMCCDGVCCHWCQLGHQRNYLEQETISMDCLFCCCPCMLDLLTGGVLPFGTVLFTCLTRRKVNARYNIEEHCCASCCVALWCHRCAICQHSREMELRGDWCSGICNTSSDTQAVDGSLRMGEASGGVVYRGTAGVKPFDLVVFRANTKTARAMRRFQRQKTTRFSDKFRNLPHDAYNHIGIIVTRQVLDHPALEEGKLYVLETVAHDEFNLLTDHTPPCDVISTDDRYSGTVLRELDAVCDLYERAYKREKEKAAKLLADAEKHDNNAPTLDPEAVVVSICTLDAATRERLDARGEAELKAAFRTFFDKHHGRRTTDASVASRHGRSLVFANEPKSAATKPATQEPFDDQPASPTADGDQEACFNAELVAHFYNDVGLLKEGSRIAHPDLALPMDFLGYDEDEEVPLLVRRPKIIVGAFRERHLHPKVHDRGLSADEQRKVALTVTLWHAPYSGLAEEDEEIIGADARLKAQAVLDAIAKEVLGSFEGVPAEIQIPDVPEFKEVCSRVLQLPDELVAIIVDGAGYSRGNLAEFITDIQALIMLNPILVAALNEFGAVPDGGCAKGLPPKSPKRDHDVRYAVCYCYLLHGIGSTVYYEKDKAHNGGETTFYQKMHDHLAPLMEKAPWKQYANTFEAAKVPSILRPVETINLPLKNSAIEYKPTNKLLLAGNILEAVYRDTKLGYDANAACGYELMNEPNGRDYDVRLGNKPRMCVPETSTTRIYCPFPKVWNNMYNSWNMCFCLQYPHWPQFFAKLLNPATLGFYHRNDPGDYIYNRVTTLWVHIHHEMMSRVEAKSKALDTLDWRCNLVAHLWGKVNEHAAHDYENRVHQTASGTDVGRAVVGVSWGAMRGIIRGGMSQGEDEDEFARVEAAQAANASADTG